ncbi:type II toxin-antitoxin system PemK/MazF family toxin [Labrys okinawensis]|uniref:type II toxin-antitoxin system PemK/MazF family toxin n=1 Tax=Labrys okinawensis TaxID=346911 RepID=UPI0039BD5DE1
MVRSTVPRQGDIYSIDPNPTAGRELRDLHFFVVISPQAINRLGVCMTVPITTGGGAARDMGIAFPITGNRTNGVALCNQVRTFDLAERARIGTARYVETLDGDTTRGIAGVVVSILEA